MSWFLPRPRVSCFMRRCGMSRILPSLYIGDEWDSQDKDLMINNKITHVVRIGDDPRGCVKVRIEPEPTYLLVQAHDSREYELRKHFQEVNDFIHKARLDKGVVLVHCLAGVSRSVALAVAYLMSVSKYGHEDVLRVIKSRRYVANPNPGFMRQLRDFQENLEEERLRIRTKFSITDDDVLGDNAALKQALDEANNATKTP